ncbi:hypothetical protein LIA77_03745 [Sarocladium implicatum]|nr:hypothetical protein LIA77_03745 [Sarocladium implicatum]
MLEFYPLSSMSSPDRGVPQCDMRPDACLIITMASNVTEINSDYEPRRLFIQSKVELGMVSPPRPMSPLTLGYALVRTTILLHLHFPFLATLCTWRVSFMPVIDLVLAHGKFAHRNFKYLETFAYCRGLLSTRADWQKWSNSYCPGKQANQALDQSSVAIHQAYCNVLSSPAAYDCDDARLTTVCETTAPTPGTDTALIQPDPPT